MIAVRRTNTCRGADTGAAVYLQPGGLVSSLSDVGGIGQNRVFFVVSILITVCGKGGSILVSSISATLILILLSSVLLLLGLCII